MITPKRAFGDWGEQRATALLVKKGYAILGQNYRTRRGEIDIIAWRLRPEKTLCFIEVKTRRGDRGTAERATDKRKLLAIQRAAFAWCGVHGISIDRTPIQFEQVSIYDTGIPDRPDIFHYVIPMV